MTACASSPTSGCLDLKHVVTEERRFAFGLAFLVQQTGSSNVAQAHIGAVQHHAGLQEGPDFFTGFFDNACKGAFKPKLDTAMIELLGHENRRRDIEFL